MFIAVAMLDVGDSILTLSYKERDIYCVISQNGWKIDWLRLTEYKNIKIRRNSSIEIKNKIYFNYFSHSNIEKKN